MSAEAAPPMSFFISPMAPPGLRLSPPVSKQIPLPTIVTFGALSAVGLAPARVQRPILDILSRKATAVLTNVPGPQHDLYLAGARLLEQMFWVPQSGTIGMGISILSYNGQVQFGMIADRNLVPDPDAIIARFAGEFEKLLLTTLIEPWEHARSPAEIAASMDAYFERLSQNTEVLAK